MQFPVWIALLTLIALIYQRRQYFVKLDIRAAQISIFPAVVVLLTTFLFGVIGFYQLDFKHFQANFELGESCLETLRTFLLLDTAVAPATAFAREFLLTLHIVGVLTWIYIAYILLRPLINRPDKGDVQTIEKARSILASHPSGSLDYFKTYSDKRFWFSDKVEGFVSYSLSRNYALVLENPVCEPRFISDLIVGFDHFCRHNGLRTAYYRVPHRSVDHYTATGKHLLPIGEEAVVNLGDFSLQGKDKKALRNALNKVSSAGYRFRESAPPQNDAFLQQLEAVSTNWLHQNGRRELVFSQGKFDKAELKNQVILLLENNEGKVEAFVNLIPNGVDGQANFDLMRKTDDAPHGTMDFLFVNMFEYLKSKGFSSCNLGMVPLSGIKEPENFQERLMKLAYEKLKRFGHYKSLRDFKEKFDPEWEMTYLVYTSSYDLIYLPGAVESVSKE